MKKLKDENQRIFGNNTDHLVILENENLETYLVKKGYKEQLIRAIKSIEGNENFIENWIKRNEGTIAKKQQTNKICECCKQSITESKTRNYVDEETNNQALLEILKAGKTKYASEIAQELSKLSEDNWPPKLNELFQKIKEILKPEQEN